MTGKKIKIALCLSGEPRWATIGFPYIYETFLLPNNNFEVDVYIHSWNNFRALRMYNPKNYLIESVSSLEQANKILKQYQISYPQSFSPLLSELDKYTSMNNHFINGLLMMDSMQKSFNLTRDFKYDIYIRSRFDLIFNNFTDINQIIIDLIRNKYDIFIPQKHYEDCGDNILTDQIAIGNFKSMEIYFNILQNLNFLMEKYQVWGENLFELNLKENNFKINSYPIDWSLIRNISLHTNSQKYFRSYNL